MSIGSVQRSAGRKEAEMSKAPPAPSQQRHTPSVARHLAQQKQAEALPDLERRKELGYDLSLPGLWAPDRPEERADRLLPALRHQPVSPLRAVQRSQERFCTLLPCLWNGGEWGSRLAWLIMPARAAARGFCEAQRRRCGKMAQSGQRRNNPARWTATSSARKAPRCRARTRPADPPVSAGRRRLKKDHPPQKALPMQIESPPPEKHHAKATGDGKGKSTAAFGLALRAHGRGKAVKIYQFMKVPTARFGEHRSFEQIG